MFKTRKPTKRRRTSDAVETIDSMIGKDAKLRRCPDQPSGEATVGQFSYDARTHAGLMHAQLTRLSRTDQRVTSRLEDADYKRQLLSMLRRVAEALSKRWQIRFVGGNNTA